MLNVDVRVSDDLPTTDEQMFSGGALLRHFAGPGISGQHRLVIVVVSSFW